MSQRLEVGEAWEQGLEEKVQDSERLEMDPENCLLISQHCGHRILRYEDPVTQEICRDGPFDQHPGC